MADTAIPTTAAQDAAMLRAWLLTYCRDRLGRDAPVGSRALAHDALDRLERGGA